MLGSDIAGRVAQVGPDVTRFQPGEDVFADILDHMGGFAEYVCVPERVLARMPATPEARSSFAVGGVTSGGAAT